MKSTFVFVILFALCTFDVMSQTILTGHVINDKKEPVFNASVVLMRMNDSLTLNYTFTDDKGYYKLITENKEDQWLLTIYGFNIDRQTKMIEKKSQIVDFNVTERAIQIREVSVKSEKIWGNEDTINYVVDAFRDTTDIVIADVLKKMPGVEVKDDGKVEYKGKAISKFYIENMDMLQDRYNLATTSMAAEDVATVQVMQNHQPVRALKDIQFSDDVAINIKFKEDAKGTFDLMADLGIGYDEKPLYDGALTGMSIEKKRQFLSTLKTNNAGHDLCDGQNVSLRPWASIVKPSSPKISVARSTFNHSAGLTLNTIRKLQNDADLSFSLLGAGDKNTKRSYARTVYFVPDVDTLSLSESMASIEKNADYEGSMTYHLNRDNNYLNFKMLVAGDFVNDSCDITDFETLRQGEKHNAVNGSATLCWIRRDSSEDGRGFELNSRNSFGYLPYASAASPGTFAQSLNGGIGYVEMHQAINLLSWQTSNSLRFLTNKIWKLIRIMPFFHFSAEGQHLNSDLSGLSNDGNWFAFSDLQSKNDIRWLQLKPYLGLDFTYDRRRVRFDFTIPVQLSITSILDEINSDNSFSKVKPYFLPSLHFKYKLSHSFDMTLSSFVFNSTPSLKNLYTGYILQNYRTLTCYESRLADTWGNRSSLKLSYNNVLKFLFGEFSADYNIYRDKVMYAQNFEDDCIVIHSVEQPATGSYLSFSAYMGKGFNWKRLNVNAKVSYGSGKTPQLVQDIVTTYSNSGWNANLTASLNVTENLFFSNKCSWSRMISTPEGNVSQPNPIISLFDNANLNFVLPFGLTIGTAAEFYHTSNEGQVRDFVLWDCSMSYTYKNVKFTLNCDNLLNTENFVYSYYSGIYSYYSSYFIRPRAFVLKVRFKVC